MSAQYIYIYCWKSFALKPAIHLMPSPFQPNSLESKELAFDQHVASGGFSQVPATWLIGLRLQKQITPAVMMPFELEFLHIYFGRGLISKECPTSERYLRQWHAIPSNTSSFDSFVSKAGTFNLKIWTSISVDVPPTLPLLVTPGMAYCSGS